MKKACILVTLAVLSVIICAQSPQKMSYQCVVRNAAGALVTSHAVGIRVSILQGSATGTVVFSETYSPVPQTNANGLVTLEIGSGTASVGTFSGINWSAGPYYLKVETDPSGGTSYTISGTSQLLSVPYALYSKTSADAFSGNYNDLTNKPVLFDGAFASLTGKPATLAGYGITNAMSTSHPANVITAANITYWSTAYGWGNHAGLYRPISWVPGWSDVTGSPFLLNADTVYTMKNLAVGSNIPKKAQLAVVSEDDASDDPLFEVRRKDGQPIFTVFNDAVTINVPFPGAKGSPQRGGFAIGGFDETKGTYVTDLLRVTTDSIRMYINNNPSVKGSPQRGGFAIGGFDETKILSSLYFNVSPDTNAVINPAENKILWYPIKNAFLTGRVLIEDPDSVGTNSFASGYESKAKGDFSQALGYQAIARGNNSTSIGYQSVAHKNNAFAFGQYAQARSEESYAFGRGAIAEGFRSYSFGSAGVDSAGVVTGVAYAKGDYSFTIGQGSQATGVGSFAIGIADTAKGDFALAIGHLNSANAVYSTSMGVHTSANAYAATSLGYKTYAGGGISLAMGRETSAIGDVSATMGIGTRAEGMYSLATGIYTKATGYCASSFGSGTIAQGTYTFSTGTETKAIGNISSSFGTLTIAEGDCSIATGYSSKAIGDASSSFGTLTIAEGDHSIATGYSSKALGTVASSFGAFTIAEGNYSLATGLDSKAMGYCSTAIGKNATANGDLSISLGDMVTALSAFEIVLGRWNTLYTPIYVTNWSGSDRLFVIGNGTSDASRSNAVTILKNGSIGLQSVTNPTYALELPNNSTISVGQARAYAWTTYSDGRAKTERKDLPYGLDEVMQLNPQSYYHHCTESKGSGIDIKPEGVMDIGLIAQDVYAIIPEAVSRPANDETDLWSLSYDKLIPVMVNAIKEQQKQIESEKDENYQLRTELQSLREELEQIKAILTRDKAL